MKIIRESLKKNLDANAAPRRFFWSGGEPLPPTKIDRRAAADTMTSARGYKPNAEKAVEDGLLMSLLHFKIVFLLHLYFVIFWARCIIVGLLYRLRPYIQVLTSLQLQN